MIEIILFEHSTKVVESCNKDEHKYTYEMKRIFLFKLILHCFSVGLKYDSSEYMYAS
jgi:hypothetical protein